MNKVLLVGRLTAKPELRYTNANIPYTRYSVAVDRGVNSNTGERMTDFINVVTWRKQAETVCQFCGSVYTFTNDEIRALLEK